MNKSVISKIVKIEKLKYEVVKELAPESIKKAMDKMERKAMEIGVEVAKEILKDGFAKSSSEDKEIKKVDIEF